MDMFQSVDSSKSILSSLLNKENSPAMLNNNNNCPPKTPTQTEEDMKPASVKVSRPGFEFTWERECCYLLMKFEMRAVRDFFRIWTEMILDIDPVHHLAFLFCLIKNHLILRGFQ